MTNKDFLLGTISSFNGIDRFIFQKIIFIIQKKYKLTDYVFCRKDYGPFSSEMDEDIEEYLYTGKLKKLDDKLFCEKVSMYSLSDEVKRDIVLLLTQSRKNLLYKIYEDYSVYEYELGDKM